MIIKKFFLTVILVFMLSFSPPVNSFSFTLNQNKPVISYTINTKDDAYTSTFLDKIETKKFQINLVLYIKVRLTDMSKNYYNTS